MAGASSGHITNLKQSILETFDIYACNKIGSICLSHLQAAIQTTKFNFRLFSLERTVVHSIIWLQFWINILIN